MRTGYPAGNGVRTIVDAAVAAAMLCIYIPALMEAENSLVQAYEETEQNDPPAVES